MVEKFISTLKMLVFKIETSVETCDWSADQGSWGPCVYIDLPLGQRQILRSLNFLYNFGGLLQENEYKTTHVILDIR